jgi:tetratricopeptide (TPR) repeat protein
MQAIVSGQAGLAVLIDGESVYSIDADAPDVSTSRDRADLQHLFAGADDVVEFPVEDRAAVVRSLHLNRSCDRALRMTLILLDCDEASETRSLAAECVEERLADESVKDWLLARLYQAPIPAGGDLAGAVQLTSRDDLPLVRGILVDLETAQPHIAALVDTWSEVDVAATSSSLDKPVLFDRLVAAGACYQIAHAASAGHAGTATLKLLAGPVAQLPGARAVITSWAGLLKAAAPAAEVSEPADRKSRKQQRKSKSKRPESPQADSPATSAHEGFQRWEREFQSILDRIESDKLEDARKFTRELVQRQLDEGDHELAGRTASKLATEMKIRGRNDLELEFAQLAVDSNPYDIQVFTHLAEAKRHTGSLAEAIDIYRQSIQKFPQDVVASCGLAEALREDGQTDEAIDIYRQSIQKFPQSVVARNGLAEALREDGQTDEAIDIYRQSIQKFPQDVVASCGLAEALREDGQTDEAIDIYRQSIQKFPQSVVARNGLAGVLMQRDQFEEALDLLPTRASRQRHGLTGWHIRGMVYLRQGDTIAAVNTFRIGLGLCRTKKDTVYYRHALASSYLRGRQHREAVELLQDASDELSDLFRAHALGELNDRELVRQALDRLRNSRKPQVQKLRDEFHEVYVQNDPAGKRTLQEWQAEVFRLEWDLVRAVSLSL